MICAVIDTNVLVSGMLSPSGNEATVLLALDHRLIRACFSPDILADYAVLARPKFAFLPEEIEVLLTMLRNNSGLFRPVDSLFASPDPGDTKILQCALAAEADSSSLAINDTSPTSLMAASGKSMLENYSTGSCWKFDRPAIRNHASIQLFFK